MKITSLGISLLAGAYFLTSCSTQKNTAETKTVEVKKRKKTTLMPSSMTMGLLLI